MGLVIGQHTNVFQSLGFVNQPVWRSQSRAIRMKVTWDQSTFRSVMRITSIHQVTACYLPTL